MTTLSERWPHLRPKHCTLLLWQQKVSPISTTSPADVDSIWANADIGWSLGVTATWSHICACHPMLVLHNACRPPNVHIASTTMKRLLLLLLLRSHHWAYTVIQLSIIKVLLIHRNPIFMYIHYTYKQSEWQIQQRSSPFDFFIHWVAGLMGWGYRSTSVHKVTHVMHIKFIRGVNFNIQVHTTFQKSRCCLSIIRATRMTWEKLNTGDQKLFGTTIQNLVNWVMWCPGSVHPALTF
jgi:hypothetical protein